MTGTRCGSTAAALRLLGVTAETPDPPGGKIARDASGAPSGSFADSAAIFVDEKIPSPSLEEKAALTAAELKKMSAYGITSLMDAFVTPAEAAVWRRLVRYRQASHARAHGDLRCQSERR